MPDTAIFPSLGSEEYTVSESELRAWMADISKDLKESLKAQAEHEKDSAVFKEHISGRVSSIESQRNEKSGFVSAVKLAGIGGIFGLAGSWLAKKFGIGCLVLAPLIIGCGITNGAKEANSQNGHIGILVEEKGVAIADPALTQMGKDVAANAATVGNEIGNPSVDKPYSPENSAAARESAAASLRAREEGASTLWQIASAVAGFVGVGGIVGWLRSALASAKLATFAKVATSVVEGVPDLKKKFAEKAVAKGVAGIVDKVVQEHS